MRIQQLAQRSGVPLSAIKFYIREGLLPRGDTSAPNQASYGPTHLERLALISTLREVAGLSVGDIREVLRQIRKKRSPDPVGAALVAISPLPDRQRSEEEDAEFERVRREVEELVLSLDWVPDAAHAYPRHLPVDRLTDAILQLRRHVDPAYPVARLRDFAGAMWELSEHAYRGFEGRAPDPDEDLVEATRFGLVGILLLEPVVVHLLRSALVMRWMASERGEP
ncbi:MAG: MerR family transcriptional regulator [Myxococcota bacterium]